MKRLIMLIFVVALSATLGIYLKDNPGYIFINYNSWVVELSVWTAIIIIFVGFVVLHKSINWFHSLVHFPSIFSKWRHDRRLKKELNKTSLGLLKLAEGSYKHAFYLLSSSAKYNSKPLINYLTAAKAAQELGDIDKRDESLKFAYECSPKSGLSIGVMQAALQFDNHEYESALATLNNLEQQYGTKKNILKEQFYCNLKLKDWQEIIDLVPDLISYKVMPNEDIYSYELLAAVNYFNKLKTNPGNIVEITGSDIFEKAQDFFNQQLSKRVRYKPQVVIAYSNFLISKHNLIKNITEAQNNQQYLSLVDDLLYVLDKSLSLNAHNHKSTDADDILINDLFRLYTKLSCSEEHLKKLEKYLKHNEHNTDLLYCLGKLAMKLENYDKAFQYFNQVKKRSSNYDVKLKYYLSHVLLKLGKQQASLEMIESI